MENKVEQLEEKVEIKKKGNKGLVVLVILLLLICCGLGAFIFMNKDKIFAEQEKEIKEEKVEEKETETKVTFSDAELDKYVNYISVTSFSRPPAEIFNVDKIEASKLSAKEKIAYISNLVHSKATSTQDYKYSIISEGDVKSAVEEVYGPNTYERTTFNIGCGDYVFRENEGKYYSQTGCGGTSTVTGKNVVIGYEATNKKLEITTAYVFASGETNKLYKDYELKNEVGDMNNWQDDTYLENYIKENKDKLNHIVYTFESKDGRNYYFTQFINNK